MAESEQPDPLPTDNQEEGAHDDVVATDSTPQTERQAEQSEVAVTQPSTEPQDEEGVTPPNVTDTQQTEEAGEAAAISSAADTQQTEDAVPATTEQAETTKEPQASTGEQVTADKHPVRTHFRTTDPADGIEITMGKEGLTADEPLTVGQVFKDTVARIPQQAAMRYMEGDQWKEITYSEYYDSVITAAKSFVKLGLEPFHGVSIIGYNTPKWLIADLGAMFAGGLPAGIYTTNLPDACQYVAHNCKANVIVVEDQKQLDKILQVRDQLPHLKAIVQYTGKLSQEYENTYDWEQFMELGKEIETSVIEDKIAAQKPGQCALLIYTSGTTGNPKGVMLSHDNLTWTSKCLIQTFGQSEFGQEHLLSYLPLSHAAAQVCDIYMGIMLGATIHFSKPDALKGALVTYLNAAQPTVFFGVPRVYEKIMAAMQERMSSIRGLRRRVSNWSMKTGLKGNYRRQNSEPLPRGWGIANKLFFQKLKNALGFQRLKLLVVGSAPVTREVHEFFMSVDMPLMELYGMSESTGPQTLNMITDSRWRVCSQGPPIKGVEIKIDKPDENGDGEICYYGRHVFMGYLNNEDKTKEAIDDGGWLHSGDVGRLDELGFLHITGRIKELIITSGGENIPPVLIERVIKTELPFINSVMVIGDHRKFLTCLITLLSEVDPETGEPLDTLSPVCIQHLQQIGCRYTKVSEVIQTKCEAVYGAIDEGLARANSQATSNAQTVKKWRLLEKDFSIPGGELGPTLKVRRQKVVEKYAQTIEEMYTENLMLSTSYS